MGGGLMQLVAYGAQDIYLTGNPQITFFKVVYRRHTNFSMEAIQQTFNGSASSSSTQTATVSRNGDLVHCSYLLFKEGIFGLQEGEVYDLVDNVELEIGGQLIDRQHGDWNAIWWDLTTPASKRDGLRSMLIENSGSADGANSGCYYPLNFWFCRNPGLALPLIALQYHEVKFRVTYGTLPASTKVSLWCDYIYLDTDERRRFAQVSHEYLIEQVQRQVDSADKKSIKLNFNHPVKELIWVNAGDSGGSGAGCQFAPLRATASTTAAAYTPSDGQGECQVKLVLNGHDRMAYRDAKYFRDVQVYQHHTHLPASTRKEINKYWMPLAQTAGAGVDHQVFHKMDRTSRLVGGNINVSEASGSSVAVINHGTTLASGLLDVSVSKVTATGNIALNAVADVSLAQVSDFNAIIPSDSYVGIQATTGNLAAGTGEAYINLLVEELPTLIAGDGANTSEIYCYSFALKPEEHQPSGTCNFSRIDNAKLESDQDFGASTGSIKVFAVNYNVLRIMSGMGGLAYSN